MAKTRRTKLNKSPGTPYGGNVKPVVLAKGDLVKTLGVRNEGDNKLPKGPPEAKPIFVGRVYTGVNQGKVYPYAGKKRGGVGAPKLTLLQRARRVVGAT